MWGQTSLYGKIQIRLKMGVKTGLIRGIMSKLGYRICQWTSRGFDEGFLLELSIS